MTNISLTDNLFELEINFRTELCQRKEYDEYTNDNKEYNFRHVYATFNTLDSLFDYLIRLENARESRHWYEIKIKRSVK